MLNNITLENSDDVTIASKNQVDILIGRYTVWNK
jgi:hypothetical protein